MSKRLSVVTVTYNSGDVLRGFLDSLPDGLAGVEDHEIYVADNASCDNSVAIARAHPIRPRVVLTGRNGGYSAGINAAVSLIEPDSDLLVLNPDIRMKPGAARALVDRFADPNVGVAAPQILSEDGGLVRSLRREPTIMTALSDSLIGGRLGGHLGTGESVADETLYHRGGPVEWASGAALAISALARARAGDWDEFFFLYSEEIEYCRRVRDLGMEVVYAPEAKVVHFGGDYLHNPQLYALLTANRIRYFRRNHTAAATALFQFAVATGEAVRAVLGLRSPSGLWAALVPDRWAIGALAAPETSAGTMTNRSRGN